MRCPASSLLAYVAFRSSTLFFFRKGSVVGSRPTAIALSMARSGSSKACVGRLWQSTHCIA